MTFSNQFQESLWFYLEFVVFIHVAAIVFLLLKEKFLDKKNDDNDN